jgi:hypothetical protein
MHTYKNTNGKPIIRRCANCIHYSKIDNDGTMGYCGRNPLFFAFTMEQTVCFITKPFYLCKEHKLKNEDYLAEHAERVDLKSNLKPKDLIE